LDANCQLGIYNFRIEGGPYALPDLLAETCRRGIARRLVYHLVARENNPAQGNAALMQELAGHNELVPCWRSRPDHGRDGAPGRVREHSPG
jgi:hypothetical protein